MAWINPELYWTEENDGPTTTSWKKRKALRSVASISSASTESKKKKARPARCTPLSDNMLAPAGSMCVRLDTSLDHFPNPVTKPKSRCSLHKWLGIETTRQLSYCQTCNVNLCVDCNKIFHTDKELLKNKEKNKKIYTRQQKEQRAKAKAYASKKPNKRKSK